jgi:hypothetical protein
MSKFLMSAVVALAATALGFSNVSATEHAKSDGCCCGEVCNCEECGCCENCEDGQCTDCEDCSCEGCDCCSK